jgi:hypothetical protein
LSNIQLLVRVVVLIQELLLETGPRYVACSFITDELEPPRLGFVLHTLGDHGGPTGFCVITASEDGLDLGDPDFRVVLAGELGKLGAYSLNPRRGWMRVVVSFGYIDPHVEVI